PNGVTTVFASNTASYLGPTGIRIVKAVNAVDPWHPTTAEDANTPTGPVLPAGTAVTYTYLVYGDSVIPTTDVRIRYDNATPGNTADDFSPRYLAGDVNSNGKLDYGEVWLFTSAGATPAQPEGGGVHWPNTPVAPESA